VPGLEAFIDDHFPEVVVDREKLGIEYSAVIFYKPP